MAGALFGLGAVTGPLLGPTVGGMLIERGELALDLPHQPARGPLRRVHGVAPHRAAGLRALHGAGGQATASRCWRWAWRALQYVLEEGNREDWFDSAAITVLAVVAGVALITFIVHELETPNPVVDLRVFANRSYSAATGLNFLMGTALFSGSFLFSLFCGSVMRYSALDIGLLVPQGQRHPDRLMPLIGRFGGKMDGRVLVASASWACSLSLWTNGHLTTAADEAALDHAHLHPRVLHGLHLRPAVA